MRAAILSMRWSSLALLALLPFAIALAQDATPAATADALVPAAREAVRVCT